MLIRSQDKTELIDVRNIHIGLLREDNSTIVAYPYAANGKGIRAGTYTTKEKAIKVLDMIENAYYKNSYSKFMTMENETFKSPIFHMPQESEV